MAKAAKKRKQLNIGLELEDYERLKAAAAEERITITAFARRSVLDALNPPEADFSGMPMVPAWLLHVLLFFSRRSNGRHSGA